jgi:type VI secretion system protein ImpH
MREQRWWQETSVIDQLYQRPTAFELLQATRLLRHDPELQKQQKWNSNFYFFSSLHLNFPTSEIESLHRQNGRIHMSNLMIGLTGIYGALPYSYTHKLRHAARQQREQSLHFLGLFNHQLTTQYIEACLNYHLALRYEIEPENHYLKILHALNGYVKEQQEQQNLDDYFAEFSGLMQGQNNSEYALKTILSCVFLFNVEIRQLLPEQFQLEDQQKSCLHETRPVLLGINSFFGEKVTQIDEKIEIVIGPLKHKDYLKFLAQGEHSLKLQQIINTWCSPTMQVELRLILDKMELSSVQLGKDACMALGQAALLMPRQEAHNTETCYCLKGSMA